MRITDEVLKELGFVESHSLGGKKYWYHNLYLSRDFTFPHKKGIFISSDKMVFDPTMNNAAKTLKELFEIITEVYQKAFTESGVKSLQFQLQSLLGLED
jgi:hypothetical protein